MVTLFEGGQIIQFIQQYVYNVRNPNTVIKSMVVISRKNDNDDYKQAKIYNDFKIRNIMLTSNTDKMYPVNIYINNKENGNVKIPVENIFSILIHFDDRNTVLSKISGKISGYIHKNNSKKNTLKK